VVSREEIVHDTHQEFLENLCAKLLQLAQQMELLKPSGRMKKEKDFHYLVNYLSTVYLHFNEIGLYKMKVKTKPTLKAIPALFTRISKPP